MPKTLHPRGPAGRTGLSGDPGPARVVPRFPAPRSWGIRPGCWPRVVSLQPQRKESPTMKSYLTEFIGTFFLVLTTGLTV